MEKKITHEPPKTVAEAITLGLQQGTNIGHAKLDFRTDLAYRVKSLRIEAKLTQEEMSQSINVNTLTYRGYENCKSDIPLVLLIRIADRLGVSLDYIAGRTDVRQMAQESANRSVEDRVAELERLVSKLVEE